MAILKQFSAILLYCDLTHFCASRCRISGDYRPAILGIVRFAIRDSVPLSSEILMVQNSSKMTKQFSRSYFRNNFLWHAWCQKVDGIVRSLSARECQKENARNDHITWGLGAFKTSAFGSTWPYTPDLRLEVAEGFHSIRKIQSSSLFVGLIF